MSKMSLFPNRALEKAQDKWLLSEKENDFSQFHSISHRRMEVNRLSTAYWGHKSGDTIKEWKVDKRESISSGASLLGRGITCH